MKIIARKYKLFIRILSNYKYKILYFKIIKSKFLHSFIFRSMKLWWAFVDGLGPSKLMGLFTWAQSNVCFVFPIFILKKKCHIFL